LYILAEYGAVRYDVDLAEKYPSKRNLKRTIRRKAHLLTVARLEANTSSFSYDDTASRLPYFQSGPPPSRRLSLKHSATMPSLDRAPTDRSTTSQQFIKIQSAPESARNGGSIIRTIMAHLSFSNIPGLGSLTVNFPTIGLPPLVYPARAVREVIDLVTESEGESGTDEEMSEEDDGDEETEDDSEEEHVNAW
jgi:hypothetical protein